MVTIQNLQAESDDIQPEWQDIQSSIPACLTQLQAATSDTTVLVDFDETLLLRNSTEEYLDTLQPKTVGVYFLTLLDYLKPWNGLPGRLRGDVSRDWIRVVSTTILLPWTLLFWPLHAKKLAKTQQNRILANALSGNPNLRVLVTTDGFRPVVAPILRHMRLADAALHACRLWLGGVDRATGKYNRLKKTVGIDEIASSVVITDSLNDTELLQASSGPYLIQWPQAMYAQAMTAAYAPFLYVVKFKHDLKYLLRGILLDQWLILVLASSWVAPQPILHAIALLFLVASFWCIYELGYYENDYVAKHYERNPNLRETAVARPTAPVVQPWIWASFFAVPGLLLLQWATLTDFNLSAMNSTMNSGIFSSGLLAPDLLAPELLAPELLEKVGWMVVCWLVILLVTRLVYWAFNHVDKRTRVWLYLLLQYSRLPAFAILTLVSPVGAALLCAQTLTSWIRYIVYRYHGKLHELPHAILRLVTLCFLTAMLAIGNGVAAILTWQMAAIFGFCLVRSLSTLPQLMSQVKLVSNDSWTPPPEKPSEKPSKKTPGKASER